MAISKIILNGVTQMDVTDTTATAPTVEAGLYFYGADGEKTLGTGSGGGTVEAVEKDVNFLDDYDGIIVYSYTAAEFANLSELPANPTHAGMTSQGWNWTLSDAKTYVASYGKLWIGQQYVTTSGNTEIDIYLEEGRLSPYLGLAVNGTVSVDWGDDTTSETITGTSLTIPSRTLHHYSEPGEYTIVISVTSGSFAFTDNALKPILSKNSNTSNENMVYSLAVKFIRLGSNVVLGADAFAYLRNLKYMTMPKTIQINNNYPLQQCDSLWQVTIPQSISALRVGFLYYCTGLKRVSIPNEISEFKSQAFYSCRELQSISIPSGVTAIGSSAFNTCLALSKIVLPTNLSSIGANSFSACNGLGEIHFKSSAPPAVDNSNAFTNVPTDCVIYVPYSADHSILAAYRSATNYPDPNTYTYTEE